MGAMTRTITKSVSGTVATVARVMMPSMAGTNSAVNANVLMSPARILGQLGFATETGSRTCATETGSRRGAKRHVVGATDLPLKHISMPPYLKHEWKQMGD